MHPIKRFLFILALTAMWSPSFLFIKLALNDFNPTTLVFLSVFLASIIFLVALRLSGGRLPHDLKFWGHSAFMAISSSALPFTLFSYAETRIESALAAILNGSTPMFTALIAHFFLPGDKLSLKRVLGIAVSFFGILCLFSADIAHGMKGDFSGMMAALTAAFLYGLSHVYAKKYATGQAVFVAPAAQLFLSAMILLPFMLLSLEVPETLTFPSLSSIAGIMGSTIIGTFLAFIVYYKMIENCSPTDISMAACLFPVAGMFLGYLFLNEAMTIGGLFSAGLILLGMLTVNEVLTWNFKKKIVEQPL